MMSVSSAYLATLKSLNLSFEESVYAIAFQLEDDILNHGKEAIFSELPDRSQMAESIRKLSSISEYVTTDYLPAIKRTLGYATAPSQANSSTGKWDSAEECFEAAVSFLQKEPSYNYTQRCITSARQILLEAAYPWIPSQNVTPVNADSAMPEVNPAASPASSSTAVAEEVFPGAKIFATSMPDLYAQLQQLAHEVQFYDAKRDQALAKIQELLTEVAQQNSSPRQPFTMKDLTVPAQATYPDIRTHQCIDLDGPVTQISWPPRSLQILYELQLPTIREAVKYFSAFMSNFTKTGDLTLWEWNVIVAVLRRANLLTSAKFVNVQFQTSLKELLTDYRRDGIAFKSANHLSRNNILNIEDLVDKFSAGAGSGWAFLSNLRNFGQVSLNYLAEKMSKWAIAIPPELAYPTLNSDLQALDFDYGTKMVLRSYKINTIGELLLACQSQNRFCGLRYLNAEVYQTAAARLKLYGFIESI